MISGATRLFVILGDPIAKVRSPEAFNAAFERHGIDAVLVPFECAPADLATAVAGLKRVRNLDGLIFTMPHKAGDGSRSSTRRPRPPGWSARSTPRGGDAGGRWQGDMFDGQRVRPRACGGTARTRAAAARALLGAGGAGRAIAFALAGRRRRALGPRPRRGEGGRGSRPTCRRAHPALAARAPVRRISATSTSSSTPRRPA